MTRRIATFGLCRCSTQTADFHLDRDGRGASAHLSCAGPRPASIYEHVNRERVTHLCAAPTVLIAIANGPEELRSQLRRGIKVFTAGARRRPRPSSGWRRNWGGRSRTCTASRRPRRSYRSASPCRSMRNSAAPIVRRLKGPTGVELITSGELRVVDEKHAGRAPECDDAGRNRRARQCGDARLLQ